MKYVKTDHEITFEIKVQPTVDQLKVFSGLVEESKKMAVKCSIDPSKPIVAQVNISDFARLSVRNTPSSSNTKMIGTKIESLPLKNGIAITRRSTAKNSRAILFFNIESSILS